MSSLTVTMLVIGVAFLMFGFGFNWRDRKWGLALITAAIVLMLSVIGYKIYLTFY